MSAFLVGLSMSLLSMSAFAHPGGHDSDMKPLATTCTELAYPQRYETDPAYPEIKALVEECEAAKKAPAEKAKAKPAKKT
ncbi:hypothetical protein ACFFGH_17005 [Lysobacter korlensis]|uniref:Uncharacterized protein n=1 Tax=Lysobacter korlensis TaxID=553636 RepID=A0ABV6RUC6_9GAMM